MELPHLQRRRDPECLRRQRNNPVSATKHSVLNANTDSLCYEQLPSVLPLIYSYQGTDLGQPGPFHKPWTHPMIVVICQRLILFSLVAETPATINLEEVSSLIILFI